MASSCNACHQSKMATLCLVHGFRVDERFVWFSRYDISVLCWIMYFYNLCVWCLFWQHYSWFLLLFCPLFSFLSCMNQFWISSERIQLWNATYFIFECTDDSPICFIKNCEFPGYTRLPDTWYIMMILQHCGCSCAYCSLLHICWQDMRYHLSFLFQWIET